MNNRLACLIDCIFDRFAGILDRLECIIYDMFDRVFWMGDNANRCTKYIGRIEYIKRSAIARIWIDCLTRKRIGYRGLMLQRCWVPKKWFHTSRRTYRQRSRIQPLTAQSKISSHFKTQFRTGCHEQKRFSLNITQNNFDRPSSRILYFSSSWNIHQRI